MYSKVAVIFLVGALIAGSFLVSLRGAAAESSPAEAVTTAAPFESHTYTLHTGLNLTLREYLNAVGNASAEMGAPSF